MLSVVQMTAHERKMDSLICAGNPYDELMRSSAIVKRPCSALTVFERLRFIERHNRMQLRELERARAIIAKRDEHARRELLERRRAYMAQLAARRTRHLKQREAYTRSRNEELLKMNKRAEKLTHRIKNLYVSIEGLDKSEINRIENEEDSGIIKFEGNFVNTQNGIRGQIQSHLETVVYKLQPAVKSTSDNYYETDSHFSTLVGFGDPETESPLKVSLSNRRAKSSTLENRMNRLTMSSEPMSKINSSDSSTKTKANRRKTLKELYAITKENNLAEELGELNEPRDAKQDRFRMDLAVIKGYSRPKTVR